MPSLYSLPDKAFFYLLPSIAPISPVFWMPLLVLNTFSFIHILCYSEDSILVTQHLNMSEYRTSCTYRQLITEITAHKQEPLVVYQTFLHLIGWCFVLSAEEDLPLSCKSICQKTVSYTTASPGWVTSVTCSRTL